MVAGEFLETPAEKRKRELFRAWAEVTPEEQADPGGERGQGRPSGGTWIPLRRSHGWGHATGSLTAHWWPKLSLLLI